jgi:hypothetical protein
MQFLRKVAALALLSCSLTMVSAQLAYAHLMMAQHGTLNIVDDAVFMVLSLPISAFDGLDDDSNGEVSMLEFNNHRSTIVESVRHNVILSNGHTSASLLGIMLSPVVPHDSTGEAISQITVMGRFTLKDSGRVLRFSVGLYGSQAAQQSLEITATRKRENQKAIFRLTSTESSALLFADGT